MRAKVNAPLANAERSEASSSRWSERFVQPASAIRRIDRGNARRFAALVDDVKQLSSSVPVPPGVLELGELRDIAFADAERPVRYYTIGHGSLFRSRFENGALYIDWLDRDAGRWVEDTRGLAEYWFGEPEWPGPDSNLDGATEEEARELAAAAGVELD